MALKRKHDIRGVTKMTSNKLIHCRSSSWRVCGSSCLRSL